MPEVDERQKSLVGDGRKIVQPTASAIQSAGRESGRREHPCGDARSRSRWTRREISDRHPGMGARKIYYGGLPEGTAAAQTAVTAKRWPQAMDLFRSLSPLADAKRPERAQLDAVLSACNGACAQAVEVLAAKQPKADELRAFIAIWSPCQAAEARRGETNERAAAELEAVAKNGETAIMRFYRTWTGYPVQAKAVELLDAIAAPELAGLQAEKSESLCIAGLRKLRQRLPMTPSAATAANDLDKIGVGRIDPILAEKDTATRLRKLSAFLKDFAGLPVAVKAQEAVEAATEDLAAGYLEQVKAIKDPSQRRKLLKELAEAFPNTKAAAEAQRLL